MNYFVYILKSKKDNRLYIGQTKDLEMRLGFHNSGLVKSTKNRVPLKLIYFELYKSRGEAMKKEQYLKSLKSGNEFKKIIGKIVK